MNLLNAFADFGPESFAAIIVPTVIFMIPIVAILTRHQQKMAELLHGKGAGTQPEVDALRREVAELKTILHQQTMMLDEIAQQRRELTSSVATSTPPPLNIQN